MSRERNMLSMSPRSPQERKESLRNALTKAQSLQENVNRDTIKNLESILEFTDLISADGGVAEEGTLVKQDEALLDSEMMTVTSGVLKLCSDSLSKSTSSYDPADFAARIRSYVQGIPDTMLGAPNWLHLSDQITKCFKVTPNYSTLLGTLKPLEKKVITRKKQGPRDAQEKTRRPENVVAVEKVEDDVGETVHKIRILITQFYKEHRTPLDYFKLILNPHDFGQTVENMLHVAFLVRDGYVTITNDEDGHLVILPSSKEAIARAKKSGKGANVQNVMSLNVEQWRILKDTYKIKTAMINFQSAVPL